MDVSAWWVFWAFLGGVWAGIFLMSAMFIAAAREDRMDSLPDAGRSDAPDPPHVIA